MIELWQLCKIFIYHVSDLVYDMISVIDSALYVSELEWGMILNIDNNSLCLSDLVSDMITALVLYMSVN